MVSRPSSVISEVEPKRPSGAAGCALRICNFWSRSFTGLSQLGDEPGDIRLAWIILSMYRG
jgi:hypothetical protein